jgi:phage tail-like protein
MVMNVDGRTGNQDPYRGYKYSVTIPGFASAGFSKVSGLAEETEVSEYREGTDQSTTRKLPGITKFGNVTLERGMSANGDLLKWRKKVADILQSNVSAPDGSPAGDFRKRVVIALFNREGKMVKRWTLFQAFPTALKQSDFDAMSSDVMIESMEITHEGYEYENLM